MCDEKSRLVQIRMEEQPREIEKRGKRDCMNIMKWLRRIIKKQERIKIKM